MLEMDPERVGMGRTVPHLELVKGAGHIGRRRALTASKCTLAIQQFDALSDLGVIVHFSDVAEERGSRTHQGPSRGPSRI